MPRALIRRLLVAATVVALIAIAYVFLWTTFMVYDDEGYVLYSLREFAQQGHLYDVVYSQYGPFFFIFYRGLHALGLVFTNTAARELALVSWIGAVVACGALVWRETRGSVTATVATLIGVFVHLWPMISEPSHPGGFIALLTAIAAWAGTNPRWSTNTRAGLIGAIGAMLVLTKINVGIFLWVSAGAWWLLNLPWVRQRREGRWLVALAIAALPILLMLPFLGEGWVRMFAAAVAIGSAAVVLATAPHPEVQSTSRQFGAAAIAAITVVAFTAALTLGSGTTIAGLIEGVILGPLRHPALYSLAFTWRAGALASVIVALPLLYWVTRLPTELRIRVLAAARSLLVLGYVVATTNLLPFGAPAFVLGYGLATAWVFVISAAESDPDQPIRSWVALVLVLQALHAYPVAGSQVSWGTFLWVPLAALGMHDIASRLAWRRVVRFATILVAAIALFVAGDYAKIARDRFRGSDTLRVPGAPNLRLPESFTTAIRLLVRNSEVHGNLLFSLPGMQSFNLWTGLPTPTAANATHWFNLLSPEQQNAIQRRLEASPKSVLIVERYVYDLLTHQHIIHETPLLRWLLANYRPVFGLETYEFWVRKDRAIAVVDSARVYVGIPEAPMKYKIALITAATNPLEVARFELRLLDGNGSKPVTAWTDQNARFVATPITTTGQPRGSSAELKLPLHPTGLQEIDIFTNEFPRGFPTTSGLIYLRNASGAVVAEARFIP